MTSILKDVINNLEIIKYFQYTLLTEDSQEYTNLKLMFFFKFWFNDIDNVDSFILNYIFQSFLFLDFCIYIFYFQRCYGPY